MMGLNIARVHGRHGAHFRHILQHLHLQPSLRVRESEAKHVAMNVRWLAREFRENTSQHMLRNRRPSRDVPQE